MGGGQEADLQTGTATVIAGVQGQALHEADTVIVMKSHGIRDTTTTRDMTDVGRTLMPIEATADEVTTVLVYSQSQTGSVQDKDIQRGKVHANQNARTRRSALRRVIRNVYQGLSRHGSVHAKGKKIRKEKEMPWT